jgi:dTDP-4-dehydrorhamnose 3,5-epimerase
MQIGELLLRAKSANWKKMKITALTIPDIKLLTPVRHDDERGFFSEIYSRPQAESVGVHIDIVQENFAFSKKANTVRGLHFQTPPFAQDKLVQVVRGAILDFAIDLRKGSPWYGQFVCAEISAANWQQILIPAGFAHGLCTLEPDTAVLYKVTAPYSPQHDTGVRWDDPDIAIDWPMQKKDAILSDKDSSLPLLADFASPFDYAPEQAT